MALFHTPNYGPIDVYSPGKLSLLLKFSGTQPEEISWDCALAKRQKDSDYLYCLYKCAKLLTIQKEAISANSSIKSALKMAGKPAPSNYISRAPNPHALAAIRRWMQQL